MRRLLPAAALTIVLTACGAWSATPAKSVPMTARASSGNMTLEVFPATLKAGDTASISLTVTGPADYESGCVRPLQVWVVGPDGKVAWTEPVPEVACMAIMNAHLADGQAATFGASWPVAASLAPGTYTIHGLFLYTLRPGAATRVRENLPVVDVQISG